MYSMFYAHVLVEKSGGETLCRTQQAFETVLGARLQVENL